MGKAASMDIESEVNWNEFENAVNLGNKEAATRYDFKGSKATIEYNKQEKWIRLVAEDDVKLGALESILRNKLATRGVDSRCLDGQKVENASLKEVKQRFTISSGLDKDVSKKIVKQIKEHNPKLQTAIQDIKVKVTGKSRDELQGCIKFLKEKVTEVPLQFTNFKS